MSFSAVLARDRQTDGQSLGKYYFDFLAISLSLSVSSIVVQRTLSFVRRLMLTHKANENHTHTILFNELGKYVLAYKSLQSLLSLSLRVLCLVLFSSGIANVCACVIVLSKDIIQSLNEPTSVLNYCPLTLQNNEGKDNNTTRIT